MLPILSRTSIRCLRAPTPLRPMLSTLRPLPQLTSLRFNSSIPPKPPLPLPGFASELVEPAPGPRPMAPPSLLDKVVPKWAEGAKPYLHLIRIDKPIGSLLLYWPGGELSSSIAMEQIFFSLKLTTAWGITLASTVHHLPPSTPAYLMGLFAVGAVVMRGAGCTINDMWDEKYDRAVGMYLLDFRRWALV